MNKLRFFILIGAVLLVAGFSLLALGSLPLSAQDEPPDYTGASECADCHRDLARRHDDSLHALTLNDDEDAILADFDSGEDVRQVQFPGEDAPRAFTADDIAFTVGTGHYVQRYLYEVDNRDYRVLPAEWDVTTGAWRPLTLADSWEDPAYDWEQSCVGCHVTGFDLERERWEDDGVQCEACHGPGENHVDAARDAGRNPNDEELAEIRAAINPAVDPQTCGQCHSRGTSADGRPYPVGYYPGGSLADSFTLVTLDQTDHWWSTGHANQMNMQYNEWVSSAHARSLVDLVDAENADPSCLTCHSADSTYIARLTAAVEAGDREGAAPEPLTLETAQYGVSCSSCHFPHVENELAADLAQEPYALCTSCHTNTGYEDGIHHPSQEMWEGTPVVAEVAPEPGVHYLTEDGPSCTTCHAADVPVDAGQRVSHSLAPIMPGATITETALQDNCTACHAEVESPALMQELIDDIQANTQMRLDTARAAVSDETPAWVIDALDFVEGDGSLGIHNYAYSDALLDAAYEALGLYPPAGE